MKPYTKDQTKSKVHKVTDKIHNITGKSSENPKMEAKGKDKKIAGKVQEKQASRYRYVWHNNV